MLKSPVYLIPFDFTSMSKSALDVGIELASANDGTVFLLHIVKKASEKKEAKRMLDMFVDGVGNSVRSRTVAKVIDGNLYEEVGRAGDILGAPLSIMGAHGATGLQKIFGSNALKMVSNSPTPFLVIVNDEPLHKVETIVMPFSFVQESLQVLSCVSTIAKHYNSVIHLVGYHDAKTLLKEQSIENQKLAVELLNEKGIPSEIVNLPKNKSYEEELSDYMYKVRADLIATAYFKNGILPPPNSFVQTMLDNDHEIPVLTVNADELDLS